ncbi:MAG: MFS transporter, partial [Chloroflexi bacterium]|nr:MFS transporter [Chloroflexota bacterium]
MVAEYLRMLRLFNRDTRLYLVTSALFGLTVFGGIIPVLLNLYLLRLGYGPEFIGLLNATGALSAAVFCLPAGAFAARWGSRRVMIVGSVFLAIGNGLLPLAETVPAAWQSGWLLGMNMIGAFGLALYTTSSGPFVMGVASPAERNHVFSVQFAIGPLAAFVGSLLGGFLPGLFAGWLNTTLESPAPYRYPLMLAATLLLPSAFFMWATREVKPVSPGQMSAAKGQAPNILVAVLTLVILLQVAGEGVARTFFNVYLDAGLRVPTSQIGILAALGQLVAVPAALLTPLLMNRWGNNRVFIASAVGIAACLLPMALIPHWSAAGLGFMGVMTMSATARTVANVLGMLIVRPEWRPMTAGATSMAVGLSWAVMSLGGGYVITALGYPSMFGAGALLTVAGAVLFWAYFRNQQC